MKRLILVLLLCAAGVVVQAQEKDSLLVMFWNIENFFDWTDQGTGQSDSDFSSKGEKKWTRQRFYAKCDAIAKSIMWIGDRYGRVPDVIGLAEVENRRALNRLISHTLLRKYGYGIVHFDSQDRRGIDVALLYRRSVMTPLSITRKPTEGLSTRDILHVRMSTSENHSIDVIVNHHPSKYGGAKESEHKRMAVMETLKDLCDSLGAQKSSAIIAMGDYNDTPDAPQFEIINGTLDNKGVRLHEKGKGTIRYKGRWELIDFFLTGQSVRASDMEIVRIPFLMTYEKKYPGEKPLRTYAGPRYLGGVSDHCPIIMKIHSSIL